MTDLFGREIFVGDIVARAIHSKHTFHKVLKISPRGITLSRGRERHTYQSYWYVNPTTNRYERNETLIEREYFVTGGSLTIEGVQAHTDKLYVSKNNISLILVV
jgi:hypothetical protein